MTFDPKEPLHTEVRTDPGQQDPQAHVPFSSRTRNTWCSEAVTRLGSGEAELGEASDGRRRRALLGGRGEAAGRQQAEEVEALTHLGGVDQQVVAADQLLPGGRTAAVPQKNLRNHRTDSDPNF